MNYGNVLELNFAMIKHKEMHGRCINAITPILIQSLLLEVSITKNTILKSPGEFPTLCTSSGVGNAFFVSFFYGKSPDELFAL